MLSLFNICITVNYGVLGVYFEDAQYVSRAFFNHKIMLE